MSVLMNSEIYIKKDAEPFYLKEKDKDLIYDLQFDASKENPSPLAMAFLPKFKEFEGFEGKDNYSGCSDFWISYIDNNGINLTCKSSLDIFKSQRQFKNKQELDKYFIKLLDFLDNSRYIGRYFKRTCPIKGRDRSYMWENNCCLVLYATDNLMLVKYYDSFEMISPLYLKDGNFTFYGEYTDEYNDKPFVYQSIFKQIYRNNKIR